MRANQKRTFLSLDMLASKAHEIMEIGNENP